MATITKAKPSRSSMDSWLMLGNLEPHTIRSMFEKMRPMRTDMDATSTNIQTVCRENTCSASNLQDKLHSQHQVAAASFSIQTLSVCNAPEHKIFLVIKKRTVCKSIYFRSTKRRHSLSNKVMSALKLHYSCDKKQL